MTSFLYRSSFSPEIFFLLRVVVVLMGKNENKEEKQLLARNFNVFVLTHDTIDCILDRLRL
jgi:hypothetical protein